MGVQLVAQLPEGPSGDAETRCVEVFWKQGESIEAHQNHPGWITFMNQCHISANMSRICRMEKAK